MPEAAFKDECLQPSHWLSSCDTSALSSNTMCPSEDDLQEAALRGDLGLVRRLILAGTSVNAPVRELYEEDFITLLHVLASRPHVPNGVRIMAEVLAARANPNSRSSTGSTPLIHACLYKNIGAVELLLHSSADISAVDDFEQNCVNCAVLLGDDFGCEDLSAELIEVLAKADVNLNRGGGVPPITEAVMQNNSKCVTALLARGVKPEGLHEAIRSAPMNIIKELVKAMANPFLRDKDGKAAMDVALQRGDNEVTTVLRDFIGDLERSHHEHLTTRSNTFWQLNRGKAVIAVPADIKRRKNFTKEGDQMRTVHIISLMKLQQTCRRIVRHRFFQLAMFGALLTALFMPDLFVIFESTSTSVLDAMIIMCLVSFLLEFALQVFGSWKSYKFGFSFWMDLIGIVSVPLDLSVVTNAMDNKSQFGGANLAKVTRMAKLGARAGRFTRLVKLLRFLPGMQQSESKGTAKGLSSQLNHAIAIKVACLIILMVILLPLFDFFAFPEADHSMAAWLDVIDTVANLSPVDVPEKINDFDAFYANVDYYPFEVSCGFPNDTTRIFRLRQAGPRRWQDKVVLKSISGRVSAKFNYWRPRRTEAICTCALIFTIMILLGGAALLVSNSVSVIVLNPLENLFGVVEVVASKIFSSVSSMAKQINAKEKDGDEASENSDNMNNSMGDETKVLDKVLKKLTMMSGIVTGKSPLDAEQLQKLGKEDAGMLQDYTDQVFLPNDLGSSLEEGDATPDDEDLVMNSIDKEMNAAAVPWADLTDWDFDTTSLTDGQRETFCKGLLMFHGCGCAWTDSSGILGMSQVLNNFIKLVAQSYSPPTEVWYHNWHHAVDVAFTLHYVLALWQSRCTFAPHERFALMVSSLSHDIGHPGYNNNFLIESGNTLALQYNDMSPLEHMHASTLFQITGTESSAVFGGLSKEHYREVRRLCIDAILSTDNAKHFTMTKELHMLCDMSGELFNTNFSAIEEEFESTRQDLLDFFSSADLKRQLRNILIHVCDISNPAKAWLLCRHWADLVIEEFFSQGDREKELGIPVQPLNDREKVNKANSQMCFIEFFVAPLMLDIVKLFPQLIQAESSMLQNLQEWFTIWQESNPSGDDIANCSARIASLLEKHRGKTMHAALLAGSRFSESSLASAVSGATPNPCTRMNRIVPKPLPLSSRNSQS